MTRKIAIVGFILCSICAVIAAIVYRLNDAVVQPMDFDHQRHTVKAKIKCLECHKYYMTHPWSGLPAVKICMDCHEEDKEISKEGELMRGYLAKKRDIPWKRLFKAPAHVYYSHRRHVNLGKLECSECHGIMGESIKPPKRAPVKINMAYCIKCHKKSDVTIDCITCHR